jgi:hypothetical protein
MLPLELNLGGSLPNITGDPMRAKKVLLLNMPFGALERQALGISLLKAVLTEKQVKCDIKYLSFTFAELIGPDDYYWISNDLPHTARSSKMSGNWMRVR